jgi:hypothetical protein
MVLYLCAVMGEFDVCDCIDRKPENSEELPLLLLKDACCVHPHTLFEIPTTRTKLELSRFVWSILWTGYASLKDKSKS